MVGNHAHLKKRTSFMKSFRFRILLGASGLLFLVLPVGPYLGVAARVIVVTTYCLIFASAAFAVSEGPRSALIVRILAALAIVLQLASALTDTDAVLLASKVLGSMFQIVLVVLILKYVYRAPRVSSETICAALSAYLILGFIWASAFSILEHISPGAFSFPTSDAGKTLKAFELRELIDSVYFSFVTLTTLGYGDISPLSPAACMLAVSEAVVGQFFLAVLIARLVGLQIAHATGKNDKNRVDGEKR